MKIGRMKEEAGQLAAGKRKAGNARRHVQPFRDSLTPSPEFKQKSSSHSQRRRCFTSLNHRKLPEGTFGTNSGACKAVFSSPYCPRIEAELSRHRGTTPQYMPLHGDATAQAAVITEGTEGDSYFRIRDLVRRVGD